MSTKDGPNGLRIEPLTETNFSTWFVDTRAELRSKKLWKYTQELEDPEATAAATAKWEEKAQESADLMTPTISSGVKQRLTEAEFNNGYLMLSRLRELLQPTGSSEFMRLSKEYYTLRFASFKTVSEYLTHIKVLEERIDSTKIVLNNDNRTILCLSMSLPQEYQYLVQIWATMPAVSAIKARQMVLEASRQHHQALRNASDPRDPALSARATTKEPCEHCGSPGHPGHSCYSKHPHLAPEWYKLKMKEEAKGKGKNAEKAREFQVKVAMAQRGDDFEDNGTRYSA